MRKINFRAWEKEENKMFYNVESTYDYMCSGLGASEAYFGILLENDQYCVEQYIGLKDCNGNGIYEGDIVEWIDFSKYKYKNLTKNIFKVVFQPKKCGFGLKNINNIVFMLGVQCSSKIRVIGNIHENPELLGVD